MSTINFYLSYFSVCHNVFSKILVFFARNSARMNLLKQKWNNKSLWNSNKKKKENFSLQKKTSAYRVSVQQFLQKFVQRPHTGKCLQNMENYQRVQQSHTLFMMRFSALKTWVLGRIILICHNPFLNRSAAH